MTRPERVLLDTHVWLWLSLGVLRPKLKAMVDDARSDPVVSQKMEVIAFVEQALANLKAQEDNSASAE